jgi:hypothetical protein
MKKKPKPVDLSKLPSMSATLLAFAKPLLDQVEAPPSGEDAPRHPEYSHRRVEPAALRES